MLLASKVDTVVEANAAHWAISNEKKDLLIALRENNPNSNTLNVGRESRL